MTANRMSCHFMHSHSAPAPQVGAVSCCACAASANTVKILMDVIMASIFVALISRLSLVILSLGTIIIAIISILSLYPSPIRQILA